MFASTFPGSGAVATFTDCDGRRRSPPAGAPCLGCGTPVVGGRCERPECQRPARVRSDPPRSWRWRKLSARLRKETGFREWPGCGTDQDSTVDHRVPLSKGGPEFPGFPGLRVLCRRHHAMAWREQRLISHS